MDLDRYSQARRIRTLLVAWPLVLTSINLAGAVTPTGAHSASVLMISVDGMKPEYVTQAEQRGLRIPFLRSLLNDGASATGVVGVWPSVTYPSHTTLLTGVSPAVHGILSNTEFDPERKYADSWYWYAAQIKVPTLWSAAHAAGLSTASVGWPVSVGSADVDYLIPEFWRVFRPAEDLNPSDRQLIAALSRPTGLLDELQTALGPYLMGNDISRAGDTIKTRFAVELLHRYKPRLMTVHLSSLDEAEHQHGPFSEAANQELEAIDDMLRRLVAAAREANPATITVIVSDHGFLTLTHRVSLSLPFIDSGLINVATDLGSQAPRITSWRAQLWMAGGMAAIMLKDPHDAQTQAAVHTLLDQLRAEPMWGIDEVLERRAADQRGAFPGATFVVTMRPGYYLGPNLNGAPVSDLAGQGGHGFNPDNPDMRAALFIGGPGIGRHRDLGLVDMRQIAPTVASLLGITLPDATGSALAVRQ